MIKTSILIIVSIVLLVPLIQGYLFLRKSNQLVKKSIPFSRSLPHAPMRILVLGDSTAVGTGSETAELSTAGRLGRVYPHAEMINLAVNGLKLKGQIAVLETLKPEDHFDLILIQIGANDIIRLTSLDSIERDIEKVLERTEKLSGKVIVLHSGNIGDAHFFPWYVRPILSKRSREVRDIYMKAAEHHRARYVDIIGSPITELLKEDPDRYYAEDFLHLNGEGYGLWFEEIQKKL